LAGLPPPQVAYGLASIEVKQTAFRLDGVLAPVISRPDLPVICSENQFQRRKGFYGRWFASIFLFLYRHRIHQPWVAVVVYPEPAVDVGPGASHLPLEQAGLLRRVYLIDLIGRPGLGTGARLARLIVLDEAAAAREARDLAAESLPSAERLVVLDLLETILVYKFPTLSREEVVRMLHLPQTDLKQTRFYQEVFDEGREEGREEGRKAAEIDMLLKLLVRRVGEPTAEQRERLGSLSSEQRGALAEAVLDAAEPVELDTWLAVHGGQTGSH
jgi:predicted transposase/invertase (TIGR01784 family)